MDKDLAERLLPLEGGVNFRDMGGYETADGRTVKWRTLFRSGSMAMLTPADIAHLEELGIRTVIDFRTATEQVEDPSRLNGRDGITYWSRQHDETFGQLHEMVARGIETVEHAQEIMINGFRHLPVQQGEAYAHMLRRIAEGHVPLAFNCTAGKDRTGGAAALVLATLGVPRETILHDFHMTERAVDLKKVFQSKPSPRHSHYARIKPDVSQAIGGAHPTYIAALLDGIDEQFGSVDGYWSDMGFTKSDLEAARSELLE